MHHAVVRRLLAVSLVLIASLSLSATASATPRHNNGGDARYIKEPKGVEAGRIGDNFPSDPNECHAKPLGVDTNVLVNEACRNAPKPQKAHKHTDGDTDTYKEPKGHHYNRPFNADHRTIARLSQWKFLFGECGHGFDKPAQIAGC